MTKIIKLTLVLLISVSIGCAEAKDATKKKYPPYPEVWGYTVADPGYNYGASILAYPAKDGDVYFTYTKKYLKRITAQNVSESCKNLKRLAYIKYFSQENIPLTCPQYYAFEKIHKSRNNVFIIKKSITFKDGSKIRNIQIGGGGNCYAPFIHHFEKQNPKGKVLWRKTLLYVLPTPKKFHLRESCGAGGDEVVETVESIAARMILLEDDTFILYSPGINSVIRFDKNFKTKYSINRGRIYLVDTKDIQKIDARLWKQYGTGYVYYIHSAVLAYLKTQNRGSKK